MAPLVVVVARRDGANEIAARRPGRRAAGDEPPPYGSEFACCAMAARCGHCSRTSPRPIGRGFA